MNNSESTYVKNTSYINKDFVSIYKELLDLVPKLTDKWDPSISNESDPGVILLKLGALLCDKNNYNIDESALETYPLSVQQVSNARKLYDLLGYNMRWYRSATSTVNLIYKGTETIAAQGFKIEKFKTNVMTSDGKIVYTLTSDVTLSQKGVSQSAAVIEGIVKDFTINNVQVITIDYLDENYRVYFSEPNVAENGIFVSNNGNDNWSAWTAVNNLESYPANSKVFKFGVLPNSDTCYIQFPQDMVNLIESGVCIKYATSSGASGNVSAKSLTSFYSDVTAKVDGVNDVVINDDMIISNPSSSTDGTDPEGIEEAYRGYKKTSGTFNTLVTVDDFQDATFNLNIDGQPAVSNCVSSDRTNDISYSNYVVCAYPSGDQKELKTSMSAFAIGLYIFAPTTKMETASDYLTSFTVGTNLSLVEQALSELKCGQYDYLDPTWLTAGSYYCFKNLYDLKGTITTYSKVTQSEAEDIQKNVKLALFKRFNARKVDFGVPVNHDDLLKTITEADDRIKTVILPEPKYVTYPVISSSSGTYSDSAPLTAEQAKELLARMILCGSVQLYKFDHDFNYDFGQASGTKYSGISSVNTTYTITEAAVGAGTQLPLDTGKVSIFADNYLVNTSYGSNVTYQIAGTLPETAIGANDYVGIGPHITGLTLTANDENGVAQTTTYTSGVFRPNFALTTTSGTLSYNQKIDICELDSVTLNDPEVICCWVTNRVTYPGSTVLKNVLFAGTETSYTLKQNEYFAYLNTAKDTIEILGSGTKISRADGAVTSAGGGTIYMDNVLSMSKIFEQGKSYFDIDKCYKYPASSNNLSLTRLQIVNLSKGHSVRGSILGDTSSTEKAINNPEYKETAVGVNYTSLPKFLDVTNAGWKIISTLDLVGGPNNPLSLGKSGSAHTATITLTYGSSSTATLTASNITYETKVLFSKDVSLPGGANIDVRELTDAGTYAATLKAYSYVDKTHLVTRTNSYIEKTFSHDTNTKLEFKFKSGNGYALPFFITCSDSQEGGPFELTFKSSDATGADWKIYGPSSTTPISEVEFHTDTMYFVTPGTLAADVSDLYIARGDETATNTIKLHIGKLAIYDESAPGSDQVAAACANWSFSWADVLSAVSTAAGSYDFNYLHEVASEDMIEADDPTQASAFWDSNHLCNRWTIPQINLNTYSIVVSEQSKSK